MKKTSFHPFRDLGSIRYRDYLMKSGGYYDYGLVASIVLLTSVGLVMLYSTSAYNCQIEYSDDMYLLKRQALISFAGFLIAIGASFFDYHILQQFTGILYVASAVGMFLVLTPLGVEVNGARRWLNVGLQFQPSEIAKIAVIVCLAFQIPQMRREMKTFRGSAMIFLTGGSLGAIAYIVTNNLSTAIIIIGITAGVLFVSHPYTKPFLLILAGVFAAAGAFVMILDATMEKSSHFRFMRILVWLHPDKYAQGEGYQTLQALYAIGSGGLFGKGIGNSIQKLGSVPEAQNDMIFSIICEELGIVGAILILLLFIYLLYRLYVIIQNAPDIIGSLLVCGVFFHIALQVVLNIAVVVNLIPNTGVTLPFFSYGGTSILFLMLEMGIVLSVARGIRLEEREKPARKRRTSSSGSGSGHSKKEIQRYPYGQF